MRKSNPSMFTSTQFCLQFDTLLEWSYIQSLGQTNIAKRKQILASFSKLKTAELLNGVFIHYDSFNSVALMKFIVIELYSSNL